MEEDWGHIGKKCSQSSSNPFANPLLPMCVFNFMITSRRNNNLPKGSNSDTMSPPVRSHSPQTLTYLQTSKCCASARILPLRGRPDKRPIVDQVVFPLHTTRLAQGPRWNRPGKKTHRTSKFRWVGYRLNLPTTIEGKCWGNRPGSCVRHYVLLARVQRLPQN